MQNKKEKRTARADRRRQVTLNWKRRREEVARKLEVLFADIEARQKAIALWSANIHAEKLHAAEMHRYQSAGLKKARKDVDSLIREYGRLINEQKKHVRK
jgi:hypothetical protein